jgi:cation diffusion facilitator family transporter
MEEDISIKGYSSQVRKVLVYTLILNSLVAFAKVFYGYVTNSIAMTSDGFHSLFDGVSNVVGLIGIWIASHPPDRDHPYGHRKYETLFTIIIAVMLFTTCFQILKKVYASFFENHATVVTGTSFGIMILTMAVNIFVMAYESKKGRQLGSDFLIADAKHTKSDIFVSLSVIASLVFTKLGYYFVDTVTGIIIVFLIGRIGYQIVKRASDVLVDTMCLDASAIENIVNSIEGVKGCHGIRTRGAEHSVYLDLHVLVDRDMAIERAHGVADRIEDEIKKDIPSVIDVVVHIEPYMPGK